MGPHDKIVFSPIGVKGIISELLMGVVNVEKADHEEEGKLVFEMGGMSVAGVLVVSGKKEEEDLGVAIAGPKPLQLALSIGMS